MRELSRKHSLFSPKVFTRLEHVYLNMGLRGFAGKIYMSNAILMTHHLSHILLFTFRRSLYDFRLSTVGDDLRLGLIIA